MSKHLESAVTLGIGTPDYMSPELLNGSMLGGEQSLVMQSGTFCAAAADVWALGIMLYLLVSGIYPFEVIHKSNRQLTLYLKNHSTLS